MFVCGGIFRLLGYSQYFGTIAGSRGQNPNYVTDDNLSKYTTLAFEGQVSQLLIKFLSADIAGNGGGVVPQH